MSVYVDKARNPFGRMLMSHMIADTIEELLDMADTIGLARRHFQPGSHPHFDVSQGFRRKAIEAGAVEVERRELVMLMRTYRQRLAADSEERNRLEAAIAQSDKGSRLWG